MNKNSSDAIKRACLIVGSQAELARRVGVKPQMVTKWLHGRPVTAERVLSIERATNGEVTRHELRPDLYPPEGYTPPEPPDRRSGADRRQSANRRAEESPGRRQGDDRRAADRRQGENCREETDAA